MLTSQVHDMVSGPDFTVVTHNINSEFTQKLLDLRSELFTRVNELNSQTMDIVATKANQDDFASLIDEKVDVSVMKTYLNQKLGLAEFDSLQVTVQRMNAEIMQKATVRDLDAMSEYLKN